MGEVIPFIKKDRKTKLTIFEAEIVQFADYKRKNRALTMPMIPMMIPVMFMFPVWNFYIQYYCRGL